MAYDSNKAAPKKTNGISDPPDPRANNVKASNQLQFRNVQPRTHTTGKGSNQEQNSPNTKGTGNEDLPTAIALRSKRKIALKLPANY